MALVLLASVVVPSERCSLRWLQPPAAGHPAHRQLAGLCRCSVLCFVQRVLRDGRAAGELSVLYPMVALGYVWTLIWSRLFFAERITRRN